MAFVYNQLIIGLVKGGGRSKGGVFPLKGQHCISSLTLMGGGGQRGGVFPP